MKKIVTALLTLILPLGLASCSEKKNGDSGILTQNLTLTWTKSEYVLTSGERVSISGNIKNVTYSLLNADSHVSIDEKTGAITFDHAIANYTQVLVVAQSGSKVSEPVVVTLVYDYEDSELNFLNRSAYITNGEYVTAVSSKNYALTYSLKESVSGVNIDEATGKVNFSPIAEDGATFTVVANCHDVTYAEREFYVMTRNFVTVESSRQVIEAGSDYNANYYLDFSENPDAEADGVVALVNENNEEIDEKYYTYDASTRRLKIRGEVSDVLGIGEQELKIVTSRNSVAVELDVATRFIYTAEDLASINDSEETLSGYYILMKDIDLSDWLSPGGEGYDGGKGWIPLGTYQDVLDSNEATRYAFKGTFDGNGHTVFNLYASRKDTYSFNAGLFGYATSSSVIRNLGVEGELNVSSYSGGLVGSSSGLIENCWARVDMNVTSDENAYRYVGGFVGSNFGTIRNCWSLSEVKSDTYFGSFVGYDAGEISNCYAAKIHSDDVFVGLGSLSSGNVFFESEAAMKQFDFSTVFSSSCWEFDADLPALKSSLIEYEIRSIDIVIPEGKHFRGEAIPYSIEIQPLKFASYLDQVEVNLIGEGYYIRDGQIQTLNGQDSSFVLEVSLTNEEGTYRNSIKVSVYEPLQSLSLSEIGPLTAGNSCLLQAEYDRTNLDDAVSYHLNSTYNGVEIDGNRLYVDDACTLDRVGVYAESESGLRSNTVYVQIVPQRTLGSGVEVLYSDTDALTIALGDLASAEFTVELNHRSVEYRISDGNLIVDKEQFSGNPSKRQRLILSVDGTTVYGTDVFYFDHVAYDENSVSDAIRIYSKEDLKAYFNLSGEYDADKVQNYGKSFILMNDINFEGEEIYGIGSSSCPFSGVFYGNGKTIRNFVIRRNESYLQGEELNSLYGVGLFSTLSGEVYDLRIEGADVKGNNFVGCLVGILSGGRAENCMALNSAASAGGQSSSSDDIRVSKVIGRLFEGEYICCYYNYTNMEIEG